MPAAQPRGKLSRRAVLAILAVIILGAALFALRPGSRSRRALSHFTCKFVCTKCVSYAPIEFNIDFFGLQYRGRTDNLIDAQILRFGAFEKPMLFFSRDVAAALDPQGVYIDVGANVGQHSLFMSRHVAKVHSFEPYAPVLEKFRGLVALNHIANIEIHPVGLGDEPAELPFFGPPDENLGVGSFVEGFAPDNSRADNFLLKIVRGDDELRNLSGTRIVLIKIDIEGFEKPALRGLARTLAQHRPVVTVELNIAPEREVSFHGRAEWERAFPPDYQFLLFDSKRADSALGAYYLDDFAPDFTRSNQIEVVAFPAELADRIPRSNVDVSNRHARGFAAPL